MKYSCGVGRKTPHAKALNTLTLISSMCRGDAAKSGHQQTEYLLCHIMSLDII